MQDLSFLSQMYMPIVLAMCLCTGYIIKHWIKDVDNKIIPTVLAFLGVVCACISKKALNLELVVSGMFTGLAATGLHQAFKQFIENK